MFNEDDRGSWGFRGFDRVTTIMPAGSRTIEEYDYELDWSGRLVRTIRMLSDRVAHSIDDTVYGRYTLYSGRVETFHPTLQTHRVCDAGQSIAACEGETPLTTATAWASLRAATGPALDRPGCSA